MSFGVKTLSGLVWTLFSRIGTRFSSFFISILLARLLTPHDFGLVALTNVFFAISSNFVDSGFTTALIREKNITEHDKNTVFTINLSVSLLFYLLIWFTSPIIAGFFEQSQLTSLMRIMGLDLIFKALSIVQRAQLIHQLKFKILSFIDVGGVILSGLIGIILAYLGFGVWALSIKYILSSFIVTILLFTFNFWMPSIYLNRESFNRLFGFGSNLLFTGIIDVIYSNLYTFVIGKFFSTNILGFYDRANVITTQMITALVTALGQVTFPILSKSNDKIKLTNAFKSIINATSFINFPVTIIIGLSADSLIPVILGNNWMDSIPYLKILCLSALVFHLGRINMNLLNVVGRSDVFFKVSVLNKVVLTFSVLIGIQFGILGLLIGGVIAKYVEIVIAFAFTAKQINYSFYNQVLDILKILVLLIPTVLLLTISNYVFYSLPIYNLLINIFAGFSSFFATAHFSNSEILRQIIKLLKEFYSQKVRDTEK